MRPFMATPHRAGKARGAADTLSLAHRRRTPPTRLPWADAGTGGPTKAAPGLGGAPFEGPGSSLLQGPRRPWRGAWLLTRPAELGSRSGTLRTRRPRGPGGGAYGSGGRLPGSLNDEVRLAPGGLPP